MRSIAKIEVAVLVVSYNSRDDLQECLGSLLAAEAPAIDLNVVVVDNASIDGSPDFVARHFSSIDLVRSDSNLGFAGGNNLGWAHVRRHYPRTRYLALLNPDTSVAPDWLETLVAYLESHPEAGAAQSKLMLDGAANSINSVGNRSHYLGFGFVTAYGEIDRGQFDLIRSIDFASAAALVVRTDLLEQAGLFDDEMFLYLEDADLSWNIRQLGREIVFVPESVVKHKYDFDATLRHYYYLERNRWILLLTHYKAATLGVLMPALWLMELGQLFFAARRGLLGQKLRAYGYFLQSKNRAGLRDRRREIQGRRVVDDRRFMGDFTGKIEFAGIPAPYRIVGNLVFNTYWRIVRRLIRW